MPLEPPAEPDPLASAAATYSVRDLGTLGGAFSQATAINNGRAQQPGYRINKFGIIVGWSETANGHRHAFVWKAGVMRDIGTLGGTTSSAAAINRAGVVVGVSTTAAGERHAFRWKDGVFKDLGTLNTPLSLATAINATGQIVGAVGSPLPAEGEELDIRRPFLFHQGVMTVLTGGVGCCRPTAIALAVSPGGAVVGGQEDFRDEDATGDPWIWENGTFQALPEPVPGYASAAAINSAGNIAGYAQTASGQTHAVLWLRQ